MKKRLDVLLVERGLATSREKAKAMGEEKTAELFRKVLFGTEV